MTRIPLLSALRSVTPRRGCPDESRLAAYCDGVLPEAAARAVLDHVTDCPDCAEAVVFLARLSEEPVPMAPAALVARARQAAEPRPAPAAGWRWAQASALATLLAAVPIAWYAVSGERPGAMEPVAAVQINAKDAEITSAPTSAQTPVPPPTRAAQAQESRTVRGTAGPVVPRIETPTEGSTLAHGAEIRWSPVSQALHYEIMLVTSEGYPVWRGTSEQTAVSLPAELELQTGETHYLWVRAILPDGRTAQSEAIAVRVPDRQ